MTKLFAIAALAAAIVTPAFAQNELETYTPAEVDAATAAIEAAGLTDTAYQNLWCGSAFLIVSQMLTNTGDSTSAASATQYSDALFGKAAEELIAAGVNKEDFITLSGNFRIVAMSQTGSDADADYTQEDCTNAATAQ